MVSFLPSNTHYTFTDTLASSDQWLLPNALRTQKTHAISSNAQQQGYQHQHQQQQLQQPSVAQSLSQQQLSYDYRNDEWGAGAINQGNEKLITHKRIQSQAFASAQNLDQDQAQSYVQPKDDDGAIDMVELRARPLHSAHAPLNSSKSRKDLRNCSESTDAAARAAADSSTALQTGSHQHVKMKSNSKAVFDIDDDEDGDSGDADGHGEAFDVDDHQHCQPYAYLNDADYAEAARQRQVDARVKRGSQNGFALKRQGVANDGCRSPSPSQSPMVPSSNTTQSSRSSNSNIVRIPKIDDLAHRDTVTTSLSPESTRHSATTAATTPAPAASVMDVRVHVISDRFNACVPCRMRKIRCIPNNSVTGPTAGMCGTCIKRKKECTWPDSATGQARQQTHATLLTTNGHGHGQGHIYVNQKSSMALSVATIGASNANSHGIASVDEPGLGMGMGAPLKSLAGLSVRALNNRRKRSSMVKTSKGLTLPSAARDQSGLQRRHARDAYKNVVNLRGSHTINDSDGDEDDAEGEAEFATFLEPELEPKPMIDVLPLSDAFPSSFSTPYYTHCDRPANIVEAPYPAGYCLTDVHNGVLAASYQQQMFMTGHTASHEGEQHHSNGAFSTLRGQSSASQTPLHSFGRTVSLASEGHTASGAGGILQKSVHSSSGNSSPGFSPCSVVSSQTSSQTPSLATPLATPLTASHFQDGSYQHGVVEHDVPTFFSDPLSFTSYALNGNATKTTALDASSRCRSSNFDHTQFYVPSSRASDNSKNLLCSTGPSTTERFSPEVLNGSVSFAFSQQLASVSQGGNEQVAYSSHADDQHGDDDSLHDYLAPDSLSKPYAYFVGGAQNTSSYSAQASTSCPVMDWSSSDFIPSSAF